jgi:hypothetical protein
VVVGISDYLNFGDEEGGDLPGAERDAMAMRDVLVGRWGFPEENVLLLLNGEATRAAMEEALTGWLPARVDADDHVVFYFAGHGSQIWDENGDEADGLDETIAPADVELTDPSLDIVDEVLGEWLRALPTDDVVYIHDNCSAATGTRAATPFSRARSLGRDPAQLRGAPTGATRGAAGQPDESGYDTEGTEIVELAASQPGQVAVDVLFPGGDGVEPFHGGAFTTFLVRELWRAPAGTTYRQVFAAVTRALEQNRFEQAPWIASAPGTTRALFQPLASGAGEADAAGLPVVGVEGGTVRLGAGAASGLVPGAELAAGSQARIRVTQVDRDGARATLLSGSTVPGDRARIVAIPLAPAELAVSVAGVDRGTLDGLREALDGSGAAIRLEEDEAAYAQLLLSRRGTDIRVLGQDGYTRHVVAAGPRGSEALASALIREAAALTVARLDNPGQLFGVEVGMLGEPRDLGLGETVQFSVLSGAGGYLTLVDVGTDGTVTILYPNPYEPGMRIEAGTVVDFPSRAMGFELVAQPPRGRGLVRALVTPEPLFPGVGEDFLSGGPEVTEALRQALTRVAGTTSSGAIQLESWGTAALMYEIRR